MRFAVKTRPEHVTWTQMRDLWVAADEIDLFESAWSWDHFYPLTGDLDGPNLEAWTSLAALAQATRRIIVVLSTQTPKSAATQQAVNDN